MRRAASNGDLSCSAEAVSLKLCISAIWIWTIWPEHPEFQEAREELTAAMKMAARLKIPAVATFTFAWPGEYTAGKPTWPMRWMTRGGVISDLDMDKLVRAFTLLAEDADRYDVDLPLCMMPWNYTNTTEHMRQVIEAVGSPRLKTVWGPADTMNCGESDTATRGFQNVRPYLHTLHIKDLHSHRRSEM